MSIERFGPKDGNSGGVPLPRGESLNTGYQKGGGIEGIPSRAVEHLLFSGDKLPDPIGEMIEVYKKGMGVVGQLQTAARIMDDIVEGPQKTPR